MTGVDKVLAAIDAGLQHNETEDEYEVVDRSKCWRCHGPAGDGASGVCDSCRVVLLDEGHTAPMGPDVELLVVIDTATFERAMADLGRALGAVAERIMAAHYDALASSPLYREWIEAHAASDLVAEVDVEPQPWLEGQ